VGGDALRRAYSGFGSVESGDLVLVPVVLAQGSYVLKRIISMMDQEHLLGSRAW
jgi:hypothetical protein